MIIHVQNLTYMPQIILLIDFEKASDTVLWSHIKNIYNTSILGFPSYIESKSCTTILKSVISKLTYTRTILFSDKVGPTYYVWSAVQGHLWYCVCFINSS